MGNVQLSSTIWGWASREWTADFPVVAEGIDYAAYAPVMLFSYWIDLFGASLDGASEDGIGIGHRQNDSNCNAT